MLFVLIIKIERQIQSRSNFIQMSTIIYKELLALWLVLLFSCLHEAFSLYSHCLIPINHITQRQDDSLAGIPKRARTTPSLPEHTHPFSSTSTNCKANCHNLRARERKHFQTVPITVDLPSWMNLLASVIWAKLKFGSIVI